MFAQSLLIPSVAIAFIFPTGCNERPGARQTQMGEGPGGRPIEHIDPQEKAAAAKLTPAKDPVSAKINQLRRDIRQDYNNRRFDALEATGGEMRTSRQLAGNGSWLIVQFYESLSCRDDEPESMWELHEKIHEEWIDAHPQSITARVAYADFLVDFAWHARGSGYADEVTPAGWRSFAERLASARKVFEEARTLPEKDPFLWRVALRVARGQDSPKAEFDSLLAEAKAIEPKFWGFDTERAVSLLPRWGGAPGEWEAYAESAAARPDGLGDEVYARVVAYLRGYHENIFRESKASWPKTRSGLETMRAKYPDSIEIVSISAMLATMAEDRAVAKTLFDLLGDTYLPRVWETPERFVHYRKWAETGQW